MKENKGEWYKARTLALECGFNTKGTQVELRKAITELLELEHYPIVSGSSGYCWATNSNMLMHYLIDLNNRKMGLQRRIDCVALVYNSMKNEEGGENGKEML